MSTNDKFDELVGQVIDERYKILSVIGIGGMSVVFKAHDLKEDRVVAVKVLNDTADTDGHAVKRFTNESRAISMLSHENIVKIYDMSLKSDLKYIVMELADGKTLKEYMEEKEYKLSLEETLKFTEQILLALVHAHEKGVIHRDIKPHNMIVLPDGKLKVTDFGIAKAPGGDTISMTDKALGTVYYISPEQASGKETGTYSDIYSVGVMLYEMATGKLPFEADTPVSVAMKQISEDPKKPTEINPELPRGVEQIILKAMAKSPEGRFKSAKSMLRAINILMESPMVIFEEKKADTSGGGRTSNDMANNKKRTKAPAPRGKVTLLPIILGMVTAFFAVLVVSGIVVVAKFLNTTKVVDEAIYATVPYDLVGQTYDESMIEELAGKHFNVKVVVSSSMNEEYGYGVIHSTNPSGGEVKKIKNTTGKTPLTLYVNPQEGKTVLEDYTIMTATAAKLALKKRGFDSNKIEIVYANHDTVLENYVFKTSPEAGSEVSLEDTITLYVSRGKPLQNVMAMPNLVGKSKGQAMVDLANFEIEFISVSNSASVGTVVAQSVSPYTVIAPEFSDKITLWVSDGKGSEGISGLDIYLYMPNLVGKNIIEAEREMEEFVQNGIKVRYSEAPYEAEVGLITEQSLEAGTKILVNYKETITIYYGVGITPPADPVGPVEPVEPVDPIDPPADPLEPEEPLDPNAPVKIV